MLLTQNPQHIDLARHHHRRHPASIATITALPHPVPGLLSLSKPQRLPSRHPPRPQSPRRPPRSRIHRPNTVDLPTQDHILRGRSHQRRSPPAPDTPPVSSPIPVPVPSPPQPLRENQIQPVSAPTLVRTRRARHKSTPAVPPEPIPSPDLQPPSSPNTSAPIPVPKSRARTPSPAVHKILSRSDPLSKLSIHTHLEPTPKRKDRRRRNRTRAPPDSSQLPLAEWDFPAPGNSDDDVDAEDDEPVTPIAQTGSNDKEWSRALLDQGPKTAPLHSTATSPGQFPFFQFPPRISSQPQTTPRKHRRAPSYPSTLGRNFSAPEAMFHLSEGEGDADLPAGVDLHPKMALLFKQGSPSPSTRKTQQKRESVDGVARQLFASSSFQIAPEPVELPKPSFLHA